MILARIGGHLAEVTRYPFLHDGKALHSAWVSTEEGRLLGHADHDTQEGAMREALGCAAELHPDRDFGALGQLALAGFRQPRVNPDMLASA